MIEIPAPRSQFTGVPGWETPDEQTLLIRLAQDVPENGVIIELGSEYGMSASLFAHGAPESATLFCVDLFPGDMLSTHKRHMEQAGFGGRNIVYYQEDSHGPGAGRGLRAKPGTDLLFIDADHSYKGVKADIEVWVPRVKVGGRVAFHDCICAANFHADHLYQFDIMRAVSEWYTANATEWRTLDWVDSIMVFERAK